MNLIYLKLFNKLPQPTVTGPLPDLLGNSEYKAIDYQISSEISHPYRSKAFSDINDSDLKLTKNGTYKFRDKYGYVRHHPVAKAQLALSQLFHYSESAEPSFLEHAISAANEIYDNGTSYAHARFFPYNFDWEYLEETLKAPWYSAMAQGQILSLFVWLDEILPNSEWKEKADETFRSFLVPYSFNNPWVVAVDDGYLWLEEYAGTAPLLKVLNGQIFAIYGLYDYYLHTRSEQALKLLRGAITSVKDHLEIYRAPGECSYYCARENYCKTPYWQNSFYHRVHIEQLADLFEMTGDVDFSNASEQFSADFQS